MAAAVPDPAPMPCQRLDLRGTPCPVNFIRSKLALESVPVGEWLEVILDAGEPDRLVSEGLRSEGHLVTAEPVIEGGVCLLIRRHGG